MEVITVEHSTFQELKAMFIESQETVKAQAEEIEQSKYKLLSAKQVAELTGYAEDTIRKKKEDIGFSVPCGTDIKFTLEDVKKWVERSYRAPRTKRK